MKVIVVDDEQMAIDIFKYEARNLEDFEIVGEFTNGQDALEYTKRHPVDLAVLDVQMWGMNGLELGELLKKEKPDLYLIYMTASDAYAVHAVRLQAEAYLTKPLSAGSLAFEIESLRQKMQTQKKRIYAHTFGHFDLYVDGEPIMFRSAKAKELLALLIDRQGGTVTTDQIIGTLWENRPNDEATQSLCSKIGKTLENELKKYNAEKLVISSRGVKRLNTDLLDCDLYGLLRGEEEDLEKFLGEYMLEYSWAENRMALLQRYL